VCCVCVCVCLYRFYFFLKFLYFDIFHSHHPTFPPFLLRSIGAPPVPVSLHLSYPSLHLSIYLSVRVCVCVYVIMSTLSHTAKKRRIETKHFNDNRQDTSAVFDQDDTLVHSARRRRKLPSTQTMITMMTKMTGSGSGSGIDSDSDMIARKNSPIAAGDQKLEMLHVAQPVAYNADGISTRFALRSQKSTIREVSDVLLSAFGPARRAETAAIMQLLQKEFVPRAETVCNLFLQLRSLLAVDTYAKPQLLKLLLDKLYQRHHELLQLVCRLRNSNPNTNAVKNLRIKRAKIQSQSQSQSQSPPSKAYDGQSPASIINARFAVLRKMLGLKTTVKAELLEAGIRRLQSYNKTASRVRATALAYRKNKNKATATMTVGDTLMVDPTTATAATMEQNIVSLPAVGSPTSSDNASPTAATASASASVSASVSAAVSPSPSASTSSSTSAAASASASASASAATPASTASTLLDTDPVPAHLKNDFFNCPQAVAAWAKMKKTIQRSDPVCLIKPDSSFIVCTCEFEMIMGINGRVLRGTNLPGVTHPKLLGTTLQVLSDIIAGKITQWEGPYSFRTPVSNDYSHAIDDLKNNDGSIDHTRMVKAFPKASAILTAPKLNWTASTDHSVSPPVRNVEATVRLEAYDYPDATDSSKTHRGILLRCI
jgi:hypothetical protein